MKDLTFMITYYEPAAGYIEVYINGIRYYNMQFIDQAIANKVGILSRHSPGKALNLLKQAVTLHKA